MLARHPAARLPPWTDPEVGNPAGRGEKGKQSARSEE